MLSLVSTNDDLWKDRGVEARQQSALAKLTQALLASSEERAILQQATRLVVDTLGVQHGALWELPPGQPGMLLRASTGWRREAGQNTADELVAPAHVGLALEGASAPIVVHWPSETRFAQPSPLQGRAVLASLVVGIRVPGRAFGALSLDSTVQGRFSETEIGFAQIVANLLGLALLRFQNEQQVEARMRALEAQWTVATQTQAVLDERQRLARELHDSVSQTLYGITLHAQAARRLLATGDVISVAEGLRTLQNNAHDALSELRLLIFELRPPLLEQVGLIAALQARLNAVEGRANLQTRLVEEDVGELSVSIEQALYRIAQEALNNVLKHAYAQQVTICLRQEQACLTLEIEDDGVGFDVATAREQGGLGLRGVEERVAQLGGTYTLHSAPGAGTILRVEIRL